MKSQFYLIILLQFIISSGFGQALTANIDHVHADADGFIFSSHGGINLTVNGGVSPYSYKWSNGKITEDLDELQVGVYCVTVTDALCGQADACFTVNEVMGHVSYYYSGGDFCSQDDGFLTLFATLPGFSIAQYSWWAPFSTPHGPTTTILFNENIAWIDGHNGGRLFIRIVLDELPLPPYPSASDLSISAVIGDASCAQDADGSISLEVVGQHWNPLMDDAITNVVWSDGGPGTMSRTGLDTGSYSVTITICDDFEIEDEFTVRAGEIDNDLSISAVIGDAACTQGTDGSISLEVIGQQGNPLTEDAITNVVWSDGGPGTMSRMGLSPGSYSVTITVCYSFEIEDEFTVGVAEADISIVLEDIQAMQCVINGGALAPGFIDISVLSSQAYSVLWTDSQGNTYTSEDLLDFYGWGTVTVEATISLGCSVSRSFEMCCCFENEHPNGPPNFLECDESLGTLLPPYEIEISHATTTTSLDGSISIPTVLPIEWTGPNGYLNTGPNIDNLLSGTYCYEIHDYGCETDIVGLTEDGCVEVLNCEEDDLDPYKHLTIRTKSTCNCERKGSISFSDPAGFFGQGWSIKRQGGNSTHYINEERRSVDFGGLRFGFYYFDIVDPIGCMHAIEVIVDKIHPRIEFDSETCIYTETCGTCVYNSRDLDTVFIDPGNCNMARLFCRTSESYVGKPFDMGYVDEYIDFQNCRRIQVCQTGETNETVGVPILIDVIQFTDGKDPLDIDSYHCGTTDGCLFYDIETGEYDEYVDPDATIFPSSTKLVWVAVNVPSSICGNDLCIYQVFCGDIQVAELCLTCPEFRRSNIPSAENKNAYTAHPNPFEHRLNLSCNVLPGREQINLQFLDIKGQMLYNVDFSLTHGLHHLELDIPIPLAPGLYFLKITDSFGTENIKLVKSDQ